MSNVPDAAAVTDLAINASGSTALESSNDNMRLRRSGSKSRKSRSSSKGRKSSHRKRNGSSQRHGSKHSPMRSSSYCASSCSGGSSEFWSSDDEKGDLQRLSSCHPLRRGKGSVSSKIFFDNEDKDTKPRRNRSKRNIATRHSTNASTATDQAKAGSDLVLTSWHSRSTDSSRHSNGVLSDARPRAKGPRRSGSKRSLKSDLDNLGLSGESRGTVITAQTLQTLYKDLKPRRNRSKRSIATRHSTDDSTGTDQAKVGSDLVLTLYGNDEDAKAKAKASRPSDSKRSLNPGIEFVSPSGQSRETISTLGTDSTARIAKVLYGDEDAKAKAKASSRSPKSSQLPSIQLVHENNSPSQESRSTFSSLQSTEILYGMSDKDSKTKAKAAMLMSSSHRMDATNPTEILYGNEADAKAKAMSSRSSSRRNIASNPGVEVVGTETESESQSSRSATVEDESTSFQIEGSVVRKAKSKKKQEEQVSYIKWIILALIMVLIGGGATAFIALGSGDDEQAAQAQDTGIQDDATKESTEAPKAPIGSPSNTVPTAPPSKKVVRDPPSAEDCDSIKNNSTTVPGGSNTVDPNNWNVNIQINVKDEKEGITDEMLQELMDSIQKLLLPSMAGCTLDQRKLVDVASPSVIRGGASRALDLTIHESRFAILYAYVKGEVLEDAVCVNSTTPESCYVVLAELTVYMDSDIGSAEFKDIVWEEMEDGSDIVSKLMLGDSFLSVNATDITNVTSNDAPSESPTDAPSGSPSKNPIGAPVPEPTYVPDSPAPSLSVRSESPSAMPTGVPSTSQSMLPSPPPTVAPTIRPSSAPTSKPSEVPSISPTDLPSAVPTEAPSAAPTSQSPSLYPSPAPSPNPSTFPSLSPSTTAPTRCFCLQAPSCDAITETRADISCGSCGGGPDSCVGFRQDDNDPLYVGIIRSNACIGVFACAHAIVVWIGANTCVGFKSCKGRNINASSNSCTGDFSCAASTDNLDGKLHVGGNSCIGAFSCYSREITAEFNSCSKEFACAGRSRMYVGEIACTAPNACSGTVFRDGDIVNDQVQQQTSYFGQGSCTCERCCVCMIRVVSFRCTTPGECCDADDPTLKVAGVQDNTEEEMRQDLVATNLEDVFVLGGR